MMAKRNQLYNVAIVGATGAVGEVMLSLLSDRKFPYGKVYALASARSAGERVLIGDSNIVVSCLEEFDFNKADIAFFSAGSSVSKKFVPDAVKAGCVVIDNTSAFRYSEKIPLVVTEVNAGDIKDFDQTGIIANPNCSTIQMVVALKPIHDIAEVTRVNVVTYQAVSGTGKSGLEELAVQTGNILNARPVESAVYTKQIAFNCIPHIDEFLENGYTREEMKMVWETKKIMSCPSIQVNATAVRVAVFF